jgi:hypothetical protein
VGPLCELAKTSGNVIGRTDKTQSKTKLKFLKLCLVDKLDNTLGCTIEELVAYRLFEE